MQNSSSDDLILYLLFLAAFPSYASVSPSLKVEVTHPL